MEKNGTQRLPPLKLPTKLLAETPVSSNCDTQTNSKKTIKLSKIYNRKADMIMFAEYKHNHFIKARTIFHAKYPYWYFDTCIDKALSFESSSGLRNLDMQKEWETKMGELIRNYRSRK